MGYATLKKIIIRSPFTSLFYWHSSSWYLHMMTSSNGNIIRVTGPLCGEFTGPGEFPTQRPVTRSFDVFFDVRLNKRLSKHSSGWWFETLSWSLWRHHNDLKPWNYRNHRVCHRMCLFLHVAVLLKPSLKFGRGLEITSIDVRVRDVIFFLFIHALNVGSTGFVQDCSISNVLTMGILQSCAKPSK